MKLGNLGALATMVLAASAVLFAGNVNAESKSKGKKPHQVVPTGAEDSPSAPVADPAGEATLERMISRSSEGLVEIQHTDGSKSMDLQGRFMSVMVAAPTAEGAHAASCHTGREALKHVKANTTPAPIAPITTSARELK